MRNILIFIIVFLVVPVFGQRISDLPAADTVGVWTYSR